MIRAEITMPPPLDSLAAATAYLTPAQRAVFYASLAGTLSWLATPAEWDAALVRAAECVQEARA